MIWSLIHFPAFFISWWKCSFLVHFGQNWSNKTTYGQIWLFILFWDLATLVFIVCHFLRLSLTVLEYLVQSNDQGLDKKASILHLQEKRYVSIVLMLGYFEKVPYLYACNLQFDDSKGLKIRWFNSTPTIILVTTIVANVAA